MWATYLQVDDVEQELQDMIDPLTLSSTLASILPHVSLKLLSLLLKVVAQKGGSNFAARSVLGLEPSPLLLDGVLSLCCG